jgi:hypothetical protein
MVGTANNEQLVVHYGCGAPGLSCGQIWTGAPSSGAGVVATDALVFEASDEPDFVAIGRRQWALTYAAGLRKLFVPVLACRIKREYAVDTGAVDNAIEDAAMALAGGFG